MPPSGSRSAPPAHATPVLRVAHVHDEGQSESVAHVVAFSVQCFVVDGVHVQSGGAGGSGAGVGPLEGGTGFATPASTGAEPEVPVPPFGVAMPVPPEPEQAHESGSGMHENPSPQVASVVHGST
jgi:hypothetical protein